MRLRLALALAAALCGPAAGPALAGLYVTDHLEITLRTGPTLENRIVRMLPSGTPVERLEEGEGWMRVRTGAGEEGWVLTRYLTPDPPKGPRLEAALRELEAIKAGSGQAVVELDEVRGERDRLAAEARDLAGKLRALETEHASWKQANTEIVAIRGKADSLQAERDSSKAELDRLRAENASLKSRDTLYWFFAGAIVLLLGCGLGYLYASSRQRARGQGRLRF